MTCKGCEGSVRAALTNIEGIKSVAVDLANEQVVVETSLPTDKVLSIIEKTGKRAVVLGAGSNNQNNVLKGDGLGAAVAMMAGIGRTQGIVRLVQVDDTTCVIDGTIDGLTPGKHDLKIHEFGDLTEDCENCGDVFKMPFNTSPQREGELGTVEANEKGRASFRIQSNRIPVCEIIGRSMVIHDIDKKQEERKSTRIACGIIARSSGLFENSKRICACDGVSLWDERDVPLAGSERQNRTNKL